MTKNQKEMFNDKYCCYYRNSKNPDRALNLAAKDIDKAIDLILEAREIMYGGYGGQTQVDNIYDAVKSIYKLIEELK